MDNKLKKEIGSIEKLNKNKKFECLHPDCKAMSIGSHSQQHNGQLKIISKNDEVYAMNFNMYEVLTKGSSAFSLVKTPIKNASTYPGFCQSHDGQIFAPIEKHSLHLNNTLQVATLFLRAITYEITRKKLAHFKTNKILEKCAKLLPAETVENYKLQNLGREKFINNDLPFYLKKAYSACNTPNSGVLKSKWIVINKVIKASNCTVFCPIRDSVERYYHQAIACPQVMSTFNLVPTANETHVVVSWLTEHDKDNHWIDDAMENQLEKFINYIAICESEDICLGPDLWESVDVFTREKVHFAMHHELYRGSLNEIPIIIKI
ncbi:hypothetical protein [Shewanella cutis]|uniref:Uncharacterized protein n=1 Tax=Shewanella cutis TaxID=2766780 RepID=A0ABS9QVI5_9GAMM|nr:hypothetical protein [Shewanella sp. PS-2]MCG9964309.1 hypothetical protein [Shewanella sp. PS-2]